MMMVLNSTKTTPLISITDGYIKIQGRSIPTFNMNFYGELMHNLKAYIEKPHNTTIVDIHFDYINCYSKKSMIKVFLILKQLNMKGKRIVINWYYSTDDDNMLELGHIYNSLIEIPFNFIAK